MRAAAGGDENDSTFAETLYYLASVSARAGCAVLVTHHTKKGEGEGIDQIRGSSAIVGACSNDFVMRGDIDAGTATVEHVKARGGKRIEAISPRLVFEGSQRARVTALESGQIKVPVDVRTAVQAYVRASPGASGADVRSGVPGRNEVVDQAIHQLEANQKIHNAGTATRPKWCPLLPRPDATGITTVAQITWARWYCPPWWREIQSQRFDPERIKAAEKSKSPPSIDYPWEPESRAIA